MLMVIEDWRVESFFAVAVISLFLFIFRSRVDPAT